MKPEALTRWTVENACALYGIRDWGSGYFDVSPEGRVVVRPAGAEGGTSLDLVALVNEAERRGLSLPVLFRFADILGSRLGLLYESFDRAIRDAGYQGTYRGAYPIKVNQKQQIVCDIMRFGGIHGHGLEAGSKAELISAVAEMRDHDTFIICNGYKDEEFVDLALHASRMGIRTMLVMEMPGELDLVLDRARRSGVRPCLGVRAKLSSRAGGRWDGSGGDRSKFGLDASQIMALVDRLRAEGMLDCLQVLHYHLGSQITDIRRVRTGLAEACRFYVDLVREGAAMGTLDVGGGLAVDYDGSHTDFASSCNYSIQEYAADIIENVMNAADEAGIPHPAIVSESGRATVAHHSVLVFNVLHARRFDAPRVPDSLPEEEDEMLHNLMHVSRTLTPRNAQEAYHDAVYYRDEIRSRFLHGNVTLRHRALAEDIFWHVIRRIADHVEGRKYIPDEMEGLQTAIADVYYGNFSLFQSLPDSWAIDQLFPVMPIHRLNEPPTREAVLADISCDSDGKIDTFIDLRDVRRTLPVHELNSGEYYLGVFLVGAYQETLGDMHNLLGDVNTVHVSVDENGAARIVDETPGDTVQSVLSLVDYVSDDLQAQIRKRAARAEREGRISAEDREAILAAFDVGLKGYTYFEK
ncbi:MAG: biosynthetic arginine decarboxylase [Lentisphaerae bacterium]|nr:biosynthetic arginine decarboxylase [Lentisphaerota bacterium]